MCSEQLTLLGRVRTQPFIQSMLRNGCLNDRRRLLSSFAALALLLTAIVIFGVMAQIVMQRTAEIGIRMALGAARRDVLRLVLGRGALVIAAGLVAGVGSAMALTRLIGTLLYGVEPHDSATFASVVVLLGAVGLAACYIPARRATRVDAIVALRSDC